MKGTLEAVFPETMKWEGGARYTNDPRDPGGPTKYGITQKTLAARRGRSVSAEDVQALGLDEARAIYKRDYWDKTGPHGADYLPAGLDACLFDISVNSGIGRARQWYPLAAGKDAINAIKTISARRMTFLRGLKTFAVYGRGWSRRVAGVEAWSIAWALKFQMLDPGPALGREAEAATVAQKGKARIAKAGTAGGIATGGTHTATAGQIDWVSVAIIGIPLALLIGWAIWHAAHQNDRAKAFTDISKNLPELPAAKQETEA